MNSEPPAELVDSRRTAWEPITPMGVAAFATATTRRLLLVQLACALAAATVITWLVATAWFPVCGQAIHNLPERGLIDRGILSVEIPGLGLLAENRFLALNIDSHHSGTLPLTAHVNVVFGRSSVRIVSLFGAMEAPYSTKHIVAFNRCDLEPLWGAWWPALLGLLFLGTTVGLIVTWMLLSLLYMIPARLVAFYANRDLTMAGAWRLSGAALMPGCLLITLSIACYRMGIFDVPHLVMAVGLHFVIGWIYVVVAPLFAPALPEASKRKRNPFQTEPASPQRGASKE